MSAAEQSGAPDVMAALDDDGAESRLVIADVSREEAWLSVAAGTAARLQAWR